MNTNKQFKVYTASAVDFAQDPTALSSNINVPQFDKAIVVHVFFSQNKNLEDLQEFQLLVKSANVDILSIITTSRSTPQAKYFVGQGKAEEIAQAVEQLNADIVLVNHSLTPAQTRNLESICQCRVVDRTGLILDIFAQRARSHEGKLQVELAQLRHLATRLVRRKTGLDQQKGAVGLRGPGETQLETDRRLIKVRITQLQNRLEKVAKQRNQNRQTRRKADIPTISLVGYTNAGKSTLFNVLTQANVYVADQLFATLDPTLKRLPIQDVGNCVLADTVGFIRELPHDLVSAFKSTLQETTEASLLLHVIDVADSRKLENMLTVNEVLSEIKANQVTTLLVYNKIDQVENIQPHIEFDEENQPIAVYLSAQLNQGLDLLVEAIRQKLSHEILHLEINLAAQYGKIRHCFYQLNCVRQEKINEQGEFLLDIQIDKIEWLKLSKQFPLLKRFYETTEISDK
ncbi:ribosome rescue GTPase HflX [Histophilus somni]|uniref:ribosome rescue GTPase HflX n=1 Tax=Histophilus somni TaxID=731 RepID=UPI000045D70E|nr:ribosome rescue GTPase HflX [Histophilus somni]ACA30790.1 GTP-binding protein HSR1-related [Histophilus somni 2336]QQF86750.1 GTPase HflX [Histophilus somni]QQJ89453.1 GTPase HflX [Histophilus somni]